MISLLEIMLEEGKPHSSLNVRNSHTFIQPLSLPTESSSLPYLAANNPLQTVLPTSLKSATSTTPVQDAPITNVDTATPVKDVAKMGTCTPSAQTANPDDVTPTLKYLRYNLWRANNDGLYTTSDWTESALPLPQPPLDTLNNLIANSTLKLHPHLFSVSTLITLY